MNIFDLTGPEFLAFYWYAFFCMLFLASILPHLFRFPFDLPNQAGLDLKPFEVAYLKNGKTGAFKAAVVALKQRNLVSLSSGVRLINRIKSPIPRDITAMESLLLSHITFSIGPELLFSVPLPETVLSRRKLIDAGLLLSPLHRALLRILRVLPPLILLGIAIGKIGVGVARQKPVAYLVLWSLLTAGVAIFFFIRMPRRTWRGDRVLQAISREYSALRHARLRHPADLHAMEAAMSMALFGYGSIPSGSRLANVLEPSQVVHYQPSLGHWGGGGGGGCGGGGGGGGWGGGGGGGGGCGGCGGGGGH